MKLPLFTFFLLLLVSCGRKTEETKPIRKDVTETVFASGILEAKGTYNLTAQNDGYLSSVQFEEGDLVRKGDVLGIIDNQENGFNSESAKALLDIAQQNTASDAPALLQAAKSVEIAQARLEQEEIQKQRYKNLLASNSVSKLDYENAALAARNAKSTYEQSLENYRKLEQDAHQQVIVNKASKEVKGLLSGNNAIKAVEKGRVYTKYKVQGDYVRKGDVIARIGNPDLIYAKVNVDESNIAKIRIGQTAHVLLNTNKDKVYKGVVKEISPSFDDASQSFVCKIYFVDSLDFKVVNTQLQANISIGTNKNALLIPRNYLDFGGLVQEKGKEQKTKVKTRFVSSDWVQVLSGIEENTTLVTTDVAANQSRTSEAGAQMMKQ